MYIQQRKNRLSRESNLDNLDGESTPRPLRHAPVDTSPVTEGVTLFKHRVLLLLLLFKVLFP